MKIHGKILKGPGSREKIEVFKSLISNIPVVTSSITRNTSTDTGELAGTDQSRYGRGPGLLLASL